jgi:GT2 family glycosyltransferase
MSAANPRPDDDAPPEAWKAYAQQLEGSVTAAERRADYLQQQLNRVITSPPWRLVQSIRSVLDKTVFAFSPRLRRLVALTARNGPGAAIQAIQKRSIPDTRYEAWLQRNALTDAAASELRAKLEQLPESQRPLISILVPVYNTPRELLVDAVNSVKSQLYANWELCMVDDKSPSPHIRPLLEKFAQEDSRIRLHFREENGHISRATQDALNLAKGEFFALLDHDDVIAPDALARMVLALAEHPGAGMAYSDRDLMEMDGRRTGPYFKPDWNPDLFLSNMYLCHLGIYRTELARQAGGFREGYEGSQDYDFVLRLTELLKPEQIVHVPHILYTWRRVPGSTAQRYDAKGYADVNARKALTDALQRRGIQASVESGIIPSLFRIRRAIQGSPLVSIMIPFRDRADYLKRCLYSIRNLTAYQNYEFILLDNGSNDPATLQLLEEEKREPRVKVIRIDEPFNYSRINNRGAREASGEHLLLLNNDTEVIEPEWLSAMLEHSQRSEVGAVGAKLLYPDGRVQHAGVIVGVGEVAGHAFRFYPDADPGYYGSAAAIRNYSAVTAACMMTRKSIFLEVGGLNETELAVAYNDVDYCLRLREKGLLIVYTPYARLRHFESVSRGLANNPTEAAYMCRRWTKFMPDPYYNRNLSQVDEDYSIAIS